MHALIKSPNRQRDGEEEEVSSNSVDGVELVAMVKWVLQISL